MADEQDPRDSRQDAREVPQTADYPALTTLRSNFVDEYLIDFNGAAAYRRAGGKSDQAKQKAYALLQKPEVMAAIVSRLEERRKRVEVDQDEVIAELAAVAFSDITQVVGWDDEGRVAITPSDRLTERQRQSIKKVRIKEREYESGGNTHVSRDIQIETHDKLSALDMLGKHLGAWGRAQDLHLNLFQFVSRLPPETARSIAAMSDEEIMEFLRDRGNEIS